MDIARRPIEPTQCYIVAIFPPGAINKPFTFATVTDRLFRSALAGIVLVVCAGAGLDIMEVDAAQYAGMARDMARRGDLLKLYFRGGDYLDKPPLLFWLSALSFQLFGVQNWSYRLPSILFAFLGLYSTYRFAMLYHGRDVARTATLMLGCSAAFFLMTNDVRCDTILMGSVITAAWLGCAWLESRSRLELFGCALAMAAGMLAKGPIGAIAPLLAIGGQLVGGRRWDRLRDPGIWLAMIVVALALLPMCIGLYQQHGWHGVRFYFWEQSFGRITGENRWKDDSTVLFFTHEIIWQALPWTLYILSGIWVSIRSLAQGGIVREYASLSGALLVFLAISLSHFKLPHYLFVALPLFAVLGGAGFHSVQHRLASVQYILLAFLWLALLVLVMVVFPHQRWPFLALVIALGLVVVTGSKRKGIVHGAFAASLVLGLGSGFVMNTYFYPRLLTYQANARVGQWAEQQGLGEGRFFGMQVSGTAMDFYAGYPVPWLSDAREAASVIEPGVSIYTDSLRRTELIRAGLVPEREVVLFNFPSQRLSLLFLNPNTREYQLERRYLLTY